MAQYNSTTINSATPAVDMMTWIDTQLTANGWTFIETWTSSAKVGNVYKSPGTTNSVGQDFYIATYRAATNDNVYFKLFEAWDAVNKKALKYAPADGTGITVNATDNTVTDATGLLLDSASLASYSLATQTSVSTNYLSDVTVNRAIFGTTSMGSTVGSLVYIGVYESLLPPAMDPVPLIVINNWGTSSAALNKGKSTREPTAPAPASNNFGCQMRVTATGTRPYAYTVWNTVTADQILSTVGDLYRGYEVAKVWFGSSRGSGLVGGRRGILSDIVTSVQGGAAGDTITATADNGSTKTYTLCSPGTANYAHLFIRTS